MVDQHAVKPLNGAHKRGGMRHSPAYRYIKQNFRAFAREGYGDGPGLGWATLRDILTNVGQVNSRGRPFTTQSAMLLFKRVRDDVAAEKRVREEKREAGRQRRIHKPDPCKI